MESKIEKSVLLKKASSYLELARYSEEKVEAFRTVLGHELDVAFKERRHEDHAELHEMYHKIVMSVPIFD